MVSAKKLRKDPWGWDGLERPQDKDLPAEPRPVRGKKDTRKWCKGKVGREHKPETVRHHYYDRPLFSECGPRKGFDYLTGQRWRCYHAIRCCECGKYLKHFLTQEDCPTWLAQQ